MDEIKYLDFEPDEKPPILTIKEAAVAAFRAETDSRKQELVDIAGKCAQRVLGAQTIGPCTVKITNIRDGDGEVLFSEAGLSFRVKIVFPTDKPDEPPTTVELGVRGRSSAPTAGGTVTWLAITSLSALGQIIEDGRTT